MNSSLKFLKFFVFVFSITAGVTVHPALPSSMDYQGFLTDDSGSPVDGLVTMTLRIYDVEAGGIALWTDTRPVNVQQGVFSIELGDALNPFPLGLFETPLWLGIAVNPDPEMMPRRPLTSSAFAFKAQDANTLEGMTASSLDQSPHTSDTGNPHAVTAAQTGAATAADISAHGADSSAHHAKTTSFGELVGQAADTQLPDSMTRDSELVGHAVNPSAHHTRYTNSEAFSAVTASDGSGSGLDADFLDGLSSSSFATLSGSQNFDNGTLFIDATFNLVGIGTASPLYRLSLGGTGSPNGLALGGDQANPVTLYHTSSGLRLFSTSGRFTFGSVEYIEDCGSNCIGLYGSLNISGSVSASGDFNYTAPRTHYWSIAGSGMIPATSVIQPSGSGYFFVGSPSGQVQANAPIHLPQGAVPTQLQIYYYDNDTNDDWDIYARVYRSPHGSTGINTVASINASTSGASTSVRSSTAVATLGDPVDNGQYTYWLNLVINLSGPATNIRFYAARVTYTIESLQP